MILLADGTGFEQYPTGGDRDDDIRLVSRSYTCPVYLDGRHRRQWADVPDNQDAAVARIFESTGGWPSNVLKPSALAYRKDREVRLSTQMVCVL
jgi:hypothetical protein